MFLWLYLNSKKRGDFLPSFYCHYLASSAVLETIGSSSLKSILDSNRNVFSLGAQGPDIFFYFDFWPFKKSTSLAKLGGRLHYLKVGLFFEKSLEYISRTNGRDRDILLAYIMGYICHYSLDGSAHPYVFYKSGFKVPKSESRERYSADHRRFETAVDILMLQHILGTKPSKLSPFKLIHTDNHSRLVIGQFYSWILSEMFKLDAPYSEIVSAIKATETTLLLSMDRTGVKKFLLELIESLLGRPPVFSSAIHSGPVDNNIDYLNLEHRPWHLPWDIDVEITSSFPELFDRSVSTAKELCELYFSKANSGDCSALDGTLWNNSFYTGLSCDRRLVFDYFDSVYGEYRA